MSTEIDHQRILRRLRVFEDSVMPKQSPRRWEEPFGYQQGRLPILLSAPHGTGHYRRGSYKSEEAWTTALVRLLAERTGAFAIFATHRSDTDPNFDELSPYKEKLGEIVLGSRIEFVLDLHGMGNNYGYGMALGTIHGTSCRQEQDTLELVLQASGFRKLPRLYRADRPQTSLLSNSYVVDPPPFTGGAVHKTVTRFVWRKLGIPAAQLEIAARLRSARLPPGPNGTIQQEPLVAPLVQTYLLVEHMVARLALLVAGRKNGTSSFPHSS